jgi:hypothetical protein
MFMQNLDYSPYVHLKIPLLYDWCMFIEFHRFINILIRVGNFNSLMFCQIANFTMRL